jgi:hypothetical protein
MAEVWPDAASFLGRQFQPFDCTSREAEERGKSPAITVPRVTATAVGFVTITASLVCQVRKGVCPCPVDSVEVGCEDAWFGGSGPEELSPRDPAKAARNGLEHAANIRIGLRCLACWVDLVVGSHSPWKLRIARLKVLGGVKVGGVSGSGAAELEPGPAGAKGYRRPYLR